MLVMSLLTPACMLAVEVTCSEGGLEKAIAGNTATTELTVSGSLDVRDFHFIAEKLTNLSAIDLTNVEIKPYTCSGYETFFGERGTFGASEIPAYSFFGMPVTSVRLPASLAAIGNAAFAGCRSLQDVEIPACTAKIGESAFSSTGLRSATIHTGTIGDNAFASCYYLASVSIGQGVTAIGNKAFTGCLSLSSVSIADGSALTAIGDEAFAYTSLKSFDFEQCQALSSIGKWAFAYTYIIDAALPSSLTEVPEGLFFGERGVAAVRLPESTERIGDYAYYHNIMAQNVLEIPAGVKYIGDNAFESTNMAYAIARPVVVPDLGKDVFRGVNTAEKRRTLFVDEQAINAYRNAPQWQEFEIKDIVSTGVVDAESSIRAFFTGSVLNIAASDGITDVKIFDQNGMECLTATISTTSATADTAQLTNKIYIVRVTTADGNSHIFKLYRK